MDETNQTLMQIERSCFQHRTLGVRARDSSLTQGVEICCPSTVGTRAKAMVGVFAAAEFSDGLDDISVHHRHFINETIASKALANGRRPRYAHQNLSCKRDYLLSTES